MANKKQKKGQCETVVYIGPMIMGEILLSPMSVFRGGLPENIKAAVSKDPELAALMVPVAGLAKAKKALQNPESHQARAARKISERR